MCNNAILFLLQSCLGMHILQLEFVVLNLMKSLYGPEKCWSNGQFKMVMECIVVDDGFKSFDMHKKVLIDRSAALSKLLRVVCHPKNHWCQELGLWRHCYDALCQVLTTCLSLMEWNSVYPVGF